MKESQVCFMEVANSAGRSSAIALDRDVKIVPVLIDDADLPDSSDLPSDLRSLPKFQASRVRNNQFERDCEALAEELRKALGQTNATLNRERIIRIKRNYKTRRLST
jgi:hypothetical protein